MKMDEIRKKAQKMGIDVRGKRKKADLIRAIQVQEGNLPCFDSGFDACDQVRCCWREDCLSE